MLFHSSSLLIFFLIVFFLHWLLPPRYRNSLLLFASYFFYAGWDYKILGTIIFSTVICYFCGLGISKATDCKSRKIFLVISIVTNLGMLFFYKYFNFFVGNFVGLLNSIGLKASFTPWDIILPLGISFYTLRSLSYTIDIYLGKISATSNIVDLGLFHAFFPMLIAGPIERASDFIYQLQARRAFKDIRFKEGVYLFVYGCFLKVILADTAAPLVDAVFQAADPTGTQVLLGAYFFALQIYGDFAGYSLMAKGIANFFGIRLVYNFNLPYLARNPVDFWNRWHTSLSSWARDYLFIPLSLSSWGRLPLGGNKLTFSGVVPLAITMLTIGLWHGAAWIFICWGIYWFCVIYSYHAASKYFTFQPSLKHWFLEKIIGMVAVLVMFHITCFSFLIFRSKDIDQCLLFTRSLLQGINMTGFFNWDLMKVYLMVIFLIFYELIQYYMKDQTFLLKKGYYSQLVFFVVMLFLYLIKGPIEANPFIYARY